MAFKGLFTGGVCQASGDRFAQSSNPLTTFIDAALIGPSTQVSHHPLFGLEAAFNQPLSAPIQVPVPVQARPYLLEQTVNTEQLNNFWDAPAERRSEAKTYANPWFRSFESFSHDATMAEKEQINVRGTAEEIIKQMESSGNPKFKQSKFLDFMQKLKSGAYAIGSDNTLVKDEGLLEKFKDLGIEEVKEDENVNPFDIFDKYWNELHAELNFE
eukprot:TRINITY_DN9637_c0_g1_i10.p1 TRINITY_DN9637_c0_g1~~TRINITY_DN9637_c0_g1_i10.p1  ORF type:complete len:214 (-),score=44.44 TRINITY_DN9637_c0_g1_i10:1192-1833(-)